MPNGEKLQGSLFFDEPRVARIVAPNLTRVLPTYSDAELARVLIHGVNRDGRSVLAMPSAMFYHLSDRDLGAIIAHLRSAPVVELMDDVARERFVHFRDDEIDDVYAFLRAMPLTAVAAGSGTTR